MAADRPSRPLRVRWLGRVAYGEALALQEALFTHGTEQHLLLLEHPHVFTHGPRADLAANVLVEPESVGAGLVAVNRGGDVTYHGPGQLVGYPIVPIPRAIGPLGYVRRLEEALIRCLEEFGVHGRRVDGRTGVWLDASPGRLERKIAAIGIRVSKQTALHGFAFNIEAGSTGPFHNIIPCGIADADVTSLEAEIGPVPTLAEMGRRMEPHLRELLAFEPYQRLDGVSPAGTIAG